MLEQGSSGAIDLIAPINTPGPPTDLSPPLLCKAGPTLAALGDPTAPMTMPLEYHFGIGDRVTQAIQTITGLMTIPASGSTLIPASELKLPGKNNPRR